MENTNPPMPPPPVPPQGNPQYQQQPNYQQQQHGYQQPAGGYQPFNQNPQGFGMQTDAPGAGTAQVCGIIGIILFFNLIGIILNIVAIVNGSRAMNEYNNYPGRYTEASFRKAKAGRTCGIVGLCLFGGGILIVLLIALAVNM